MSQNIDSSIPNNHDEAERLFQMGKKYNSDGSERNYQEAWTCLRKAAEAGHASAQNALGAMYEEIEGNEENAAEALKWHTKAAEQGNTDSMWALGMKYAEGRGVALDVTEAEQWFRKAVEQARVAAEQGDASAMLILFRAYAKGIVVEQNISEAEQWMEKIVGDSETKPNPDTQHLSEAENWIYWQKTNNNEMAKHDLQHISGNATDVAVKRFREAAEQGDVRAMINLANLHSRNWHLLYYGENEKESALAAEWYRKAADLGNPQAMEALGHYFSYYKQNKEDGWYWYRRAVEKHQKAAEQGDPLAMYAIGRIYLDFESTKPLSYKAPHETQYWYRKAADIGYVKAILSLSGVNFHRLLQHTQTVSELTMWRLKLAKLGYKKAMMDVGEEFFFKKGDVNRTMAHEWYLKVATYLHTQMESPLCLALGLVSPGFACYQLGDCYAKMDKKEEAQKWYLKAAELGVDWALDKLKELNKPSWRKWLHL